jgi:hypothetical protein
VHRDGGQSGAREEPDQGQLLQALAVPGTAPLRDGGGSGIVMGRHRQGDTTTSGKIKPPALATGVGTVIVQITNLGNGQSDSNFTATLAIRTTSGGAVRYVDLPDGKGSATVASGEEATLVVANTPKTLYLYDPSSVGASDPAMAGLNYQVQLTGATPAN